MIKIYPETPDDIVAVNALTAQAFGRPAEADLIDRLRQNGRVVLSLVATEFGNVVGHVMFSPVEFSGDAKGVALGPIAVAEGYRSRGIARALIEQGVATLCAGGWQFVMLLGSPNLYPRFGFLPGCHFGLRSDFDVPDEQFMVLELRSGALSGASGTASFAPEFHEV